MIRRLVLASSVALLGGCATMNTVVADVSSFGEWPAGRASGTYAFERLPSQQARASDADQLEQLARPALEKAGFKAIAPGQEPDVLVQVGARISQLARSPWDDPLWWRGGFGWYRHGPWGGPAWSLSARIDTLRYAREAGVLIRDRSSGKPLYEARAVNDSGPRDDAAVIGALFEAALADFPRPALNPRRVSVTLPP